MPPENNKSLSAPHSGQPAFSGKHGSTSEPALVAELVGKSVQSQTPVQAQTLAGSASIKIGAPATAQDNQPQTNTSSSPKPKAQALSLLAALSAYAMWGVLPLYWKTMSAVPAFEILLHRIFWSFIFLLLLVCCTKQLKSCLGVLQERKKSLLLLASSLCLSANWLIYIWAVNNEHVIDASLGYFLTPLLNMCMGVLIFRDRPNRLQWCAILLAAAGVSCQVIMLGKLPLIAISLALSFSAYAVLRKINTVDAVSGLFWETAFMLPLVFAAFALLHMNGQTHFDVPALLLIMLMLSGIITTVPLVFFTYSAKRLSLITLGLLQYIGPSLSLAIGVFIFKEVLQAGHVVSFVLIWLALALYSAESIRIYAATPLKQAQ